MEIKTIGRGNDHVFKHGGLQPMTEEYAHGERGDLPYIPPDAALERERKSEKLHLTRQVEEAQREAGVAARLAEQERDARVARETELAISQERVALLEEQLRVAEATTRAAQDAAAAAAAGKTVEPDTKGKPAGRNG